MIQSLTMQDKNFENMESQLNIDIDQIAENRQLAISKLVTNFKKNNKDRMCQILHASENIDIKATGNHIKRHLKKFH